MIKSMNTAKSTLILAAAASLMATPALAASKNHLTNPPHKCDAQTGTCGCNNDKVSAGCIKIQLDAGKTSPWTGSKSIQVKVFADDESPMVFTPDSLYIVMDYTYKRIGNTLLADGKTPKEVIFSHPMGESVRFTFKEGESIAVPARSPVRQSRERLMMVDAQGWATTRNPVYWDLYPGDGKVVRFLATNATGERGRMISVTDSRGAVVTPADMGIDFVRNADGLRQFLSPSRLVDVQASSGGYDVTIYPVQETPARDAASGLYAVPDVEPTERLSVRRGENDRRAVVTLRSGASAARTYVFTYVDSDWSLLRPNGAREVKALSGEEGVGATWSKEIRSPSGEVLSRDVKYYGWIGDDYALTNKTDGFGGVTASRSWTYVASGNGKGLIASETSSSGLHVEYVYDAADRVVRETRSGPDMMTEVIEKSYSSVDPSDAVPPVDSRPRAVVRKLDGIECERTYYVYSPLTNIVERVGTQGAAYGGANALRTVTTFYPVGGGTGIGNGGSGVGAGFVQSIRHEDGRLDLYDYALVSNLWTETVTHLHEQSPSPVSGKTIRDITLTNASGEVLEKKTEAYIDGIWHAVARNRMTYNLQGRRTSIENLAGQVTTTAWDCCHKVSETGPDGSTRTWDYDDDGRMIATSRLIPLDMTNVTWLTTCYEYDDLGREVATWQTNYAAQVGLPVTRTRYDQLGRTASRIDILGNTTVMSYSPDGRTEYVRRPNTSTRVVSRSASGDTLSIIGTAVTPEFRTYGILPDGTRWSRTVQGETANSPRFTKRCVNLLGQTIREERSGFQGAILATTHAYDSLGRLVATSADYEPVVEYTYDVLGNRVATTKTVGRGDPTAPQSADVQWRKSETSAAFALDGDIVWIAQTNIVSCSDPSIAPLATSSARQLTGLTPALPSRSRSTDIRGNVTEKDMVVESSIVTSRKTVPYATNKPLSVSRYGVSLMNVSVSAVTNTVAYDALGRVTAHTDGRGNTRHAEYNARARRSASIDALGKRTTYAYDQFGNLASVTDPLGHAIVYEYDLRGRKTYEGGATCPVSYAYDVFSAITNVTTYHDESSGAGSSISYEYDAGSRALVRQTNADQTSTVYAFNAGGKLTSRTLARGIVSEYLHDAWNAVTNISYSDSTPSVSIQHDGMGRLSCVQDATGPASFAYDSYGQFTNEVTASASVVRFYDEFGRDVGYAHSSGTTTTNVYDKSTGRLSATSFDGIAFSYGYVPGADLEAMISTPGFDKVVRYEPCRDRVAEIAYTNSCLIASRSYEYDAAGNITSRVQRRKGCLDRSDDFLCDSRCQLTNAVIGSANYSYCFDDAGNRKSSAEHGMAVEYQVNGLNQYTCITNDESGSWRPLYDADGNQTLVKTKSGVWSVVYDGENQPVQWSCGTTTVVLTYDWGGRCVGKKVLEGGVVRKESRFDYNGGVRVAESVVSGGQTSLVSRVFWDPSQAESSRALAVANHLGQRFYCAIDITKNVCEMLAPDGAVVQTYDYAPFGNVAVGSGDFSSPLQWSSEFFDEDVGVVSYLSRNYDPLTGRWLSRDPLHQDGYNLYAYVRNQPMSKVDMLGLAISGSECEKARDSLLNGDMANGVDGRNAAALISAIRSDANCTVPTINCGCCDAAGQFGGSTRDGSGTITICTNNAISASYVYGTIVHELIHAYDSCKGTDFSDCEQRACSEIRAYKNSGQCQYGGACRRMVYSPIRNIDGSPVGYYETEEQCLKRSAKASTSADWKCLSNIDKYVNDAYKNCADNKDPF